MSADLRPALTADFSRLARRLAASAQRTRTGADAEAIHDLRVATRRATAWLRLWEPALRPRRARRLRRALRMLRRALAIAREAQVHEQLLRRRFEDPGVAAIEGMNELLAGFAGQARRLERRAARTMVRPRTRRLLRALEGEPPLTRRVIDEAAMLAWARARSAGLEAVVRGALERAQEPDPEVAHRARIAVKICRYTRERLAAALQLEPRAQLSELTETQERLGKLHDLATFAAALARDRDRAMAVGAMARARAASTLLAGVEREAREAREGMGTLEIPPLAELEGSA